MSQPATQTIFDIARGRQYARAILAVGKYSLRPEHWAALNDYAFELARRYVRIFGK